MVLICPALYRRVAALSQRPPCVTFGAYYTYCRYPLRWGTGMDEFLMMNIFFVIAAIGTVIFIVLMSILLFYGIQLTKTLDRIAHTVEDEAQALKGDLDAARARMKRGGWSLLSLFGFAGKTGVRLLSKKRSRS